MIELVDLRKEYKQGNDTVEALKKVNLSLPDTGLVFILGKSGSGKSTLLNMLGSLDDITSGDILVDGVSLSKLNERELNVYRSDYISVIYQNFNLFESETVYENVLVGARLFDADKVNRGKKIEEIIKKVDLEDKTHTIVKNLSGGQKQRVAIARALVKNSRVLLADEPTGNLDTKNTKIIFDILKDISKDKLVIVVSHDMKSAEAYADRIVFLSDGEVYQDEIVNHEYKNVKDGEIEIPTNSKLSESNLEKINKDLEKHELKLVRQKPHFLPFEGKIEGKQEKPKFVKKHKLLKDSLRLSWNFFKDSKASFIVTMVISALLISLLVLARNFTFYDSNAAIDLVNEKYGAKSYVVNKAYSYYNDTSKINTAYLINVKEDDKDKFVEGGYKGNIYYLYQKVFNIYNSGWRIDNYKQMSDTNYNEFYTKEGMGVAVVNKEYLEHIFPDYEVLAGTLYGMDEEDEIRLIVTDYFADSILFYNDHYSNGSYASDDPHDPYQKIVNVNFGANTYIGAIISTGYKDRYGDLIDKFSSIYTEPQNASEIYKELIDREDLQAFLLEANQTLNINYSLNQNYKNAVIENSTNRSSYLKYQNAIINDDKGNTLGSFTTSYTAKYDKSLSKGEMVMNIATYNVLFGKALTKNDTSDFEEKNIVMYYYRLDQDVSKDKPYLTLPLKVIGVENASDKETNTGYFSFEDYKILKAEHIVPYALIFDDPSQAYLINEVSIDNYYYTSNTSYKAAFTICDIVSIFSDIVAYMGAIIIIIAVLNIVFHTLRVIKKNSYQIGVYRSVGYPISTIVIASILNTIYLIIAIFITSTILSSSSAYLVNQIVQENFIRYIKFNLASELTFVHFSMPILGLYMVIILLVEVITLVLPIHSIRKLKPNKILYKAVE